MIHEAAFFFFSFFFFFLNQSWILEYIIVYEGNHRKYPDWLPGISERPKNEGGNPHRFLLSSNLL